MAATYDIIILVTDVHGLIREFKEFLEGMIAKYGGDNIAYVVQLGDFFKGRNVIRGEKTFTFWKDPSIFSDLPFPIFSIKGNEDINIPESWFSGMISVFPNLKEFILDDLKIIPVSFFEESEDYYKSHGIKKLIELTDDKKGQGKATSEQKEGYIQLFDFEPSNEKPISQVLTDRNEIDIIMSHVPPFGYLDRTRDYATHQEIHGTGNKFLRMLIDKRKPRMVIFGHNHYCNFQKFGDLAVLSIDKFCRKMAEGIEESVDLDKEDEANVSATKKMFGGRQKPKIAEVKDTNYFSYCLIIRKGNSYVLEVYRRDQLIIQYDLFNKKVLMNKL